MTDPPPSPTRRQFTVLILILAVAGFLRFDRIAEPSLWVDEIWSIEMAMGNGSLHDYLPPNVIRDDQPDLTGLSHAAPWWSILTHVSGVIHPPIYFIVLAGGWTSSAPAPLRRDPCRRSSPSRGLWFSSMCADSCTARASLCSPPPS
jgi:hypothetical protein